MHNTNICITNNYNNSNNNRNSNNMASSTTAQPSYDEDGNLMFDESGKRIDEYGRHILDDQGRPIYDKNGLRIQYELNLDEITAVLPQVMSRQATINVGTIGHVSHGKSTLVRHISHKNTLRHRMELVRNITIKLGYANAKLFKCTGVKVIPELKEGEIIEAFHKPSRSWLPARIIRAHPDRTFDVDFDTATAPESVIKAREARAQQAKEGDTSPSSEDSSPNSKNYDLVGVHEEQIRSTNWKQEKWVEPKSKLGNYSSQDGAWADYYETTSEKSVRDFATGREKIVRERKRWELERHISFVDCPGHDVFMATMLNGAAIMDAAVLLVAANEQCPMPQTSEHVAAVEIMKLENIIICQNKVDLLKNQTGRAEQHKTEIEEFAKGTIVHNKPIIPISAVLGHNVGTVIEYLCRNVPIPIRNFKAIPRMIVIRSFDVNKPGDAISGLKGGVAGGSIFEGVFKIGDEIEIRPGNVVRNNGKFTCQVLYSKIRALKSDEEGRVDLQYAIPGGLIAIGTSLDPSITRADRLVGQVLGLKGKLPDVYKELNARVVLLRLLLGVRVVQGEQAEVEPLQIQETLQLNIGSNTVAATVSVVRLDPNNDLESLVTLKLNTPVCVGDKEKIAISRRIDRNWRLIGWGDILSGQNAKVDEKFNPTKEKSSK